MFQFMEIAARFNAETLPYEKINALAKNSRSIDEIALALAKLIHTMFAQPDQHHSQFTMIEPIVREYMLPMLDNKNKQPINFLKRKFNHVATDSVEQAIPPHQLSSLKEHIDFFLANISTQLITKKQAGFIAALADKLPLNYLYNLAIVEIRLNDNDAVDLELQPPLTGDLCLEKYQNTPSWNLVKNSITACRKINKNNFLVKPDWLEFDINGTDSDIEPSIFFHFSPELSPPEKQADFLALLKNDLPISISDSSIMMIKKCLAYLPPGLQISNVGHMLARNQSLCKIIIFNFPPAQIIPYLRDLKWQGNYEFIEKLFNHVKELPYRFALALDINGDTMQKISIEINHNPASKNYFNKTLEFFVAEGLCTRAKMSALLEAEFFYWAENLNFYLAQIAHLKISLEENVISAKSYLRYQTSAALMRESLRAYYLTFIK